MTQSLILITTLAIMAGLGVGYWFGWLTELAVEVITEIVAMGTVVSIMADSIRDLGMEIKGGRAYE